MKWLSIREVVNKLDIADPTLRRYIEYHRDFIKMRKSEDVLMINAESLEVLKQIREWYMSGYRRKRVHDMLRDHFTMSIVINNEDQEKSLSVGEVVQVIDRLSKENKALAVQVDELKALIETNNRLIKEVAATKEEKKFSFLKRFFGKGSR